MRLQYTASTAHLFRRRVWRHYDAYGRHDLPWRKTKNPYKILVSEIMLQQTQVARVIPKYHAFLDTFPTIQSLARAPLRDVLALWQGLGYNKRAKALHDASRLVCEHHNGRIPRTEHELTVLPGIGTYTARAVLAFAYAQAVPLIETNIRTVILHELLSGRTSVSDSELLELAEQMLERKRPREWQWALMDYGAQLKKRGVRLNAAHQGYVAQSRFKGSNREIRGAILRHVIVGNGLTVRALTKALPFPATRIQMQVTALVREGLVRKHGTRFVA